MNKNAVLVALYTKADNARNPKESKAFLEAAALVESIDDDDDEEQVEDDGNELEAIYRAQDAVAEARYPARGEDDYPNDIHD